MDAAIRQQILSVWDELLARGVEHLDVFGSHARGTARVDSDVDVLVHFGAAPSLSTLVTVRDLLRAALDREVDMVTPGALTERPRLRDRVLREAIRVA